MNFYSGYGIMYTGEPIKTGTDLIQRHRPKPPLCKAPEAAVQRRCGDHVSGGGIVNYCTKPQINAYLQPLSHLTVPALPKARLRMPQALLRCPCTGEPIEACADLSKCPYTGEPIEVRTDPIQRHLPKPPLCKGRGTTLVVEGL